MKKLAIALLMVRSVWAAEPTPRASSAWKASLIALTAANAMDAASSYGRRELNPVLRSADGRFGTRAVALKVGVNAAVVGVQYLVLRRNPRAQRCAAIANTGVAVGWSAAAARNWRLNGTHGR